MIDLLFSRTKFEYIIGIIGWGFLTEKSLGDAAAIHRKEEEFIMKSEIRFGKYLGSNCGGF